MPLGKALDALKRLWRSVFDRGRKDTPSGELSTETPTSEPTPPDVPPSVAEPTEAPPSDEPPSGTSPSIPEPTEAPKADEPSTEPPLSPSDEEVQGDQESIERPVKEPPGLGPREIGGRRSEKGESASGRRTGPERSPRVRPLELICREASEGVQEIALVSSEERPIRGVRSAGAAIRKVKEAWPLPSLDEIVVAYEDGSEEPFPLSSSEPLIFKHKRDWRGDGRRVPRLTRGCFVVIAPAEWRRLDQPRVEPAPCSISNWTAHYFLLDTEAEAGPIGFREYSLEASKLRFQLSGEQVHDDSEDGKLFIGGAPELTCTPGITWVRVGEEGMEGWGKNFDPSGRSLDEVLNGRQGRFFVRVYEEKLLVDTGQFRYHQSLKEITVGGAQYTEDMLLLPLKRGYARTRVRFVDTGGGAIRPTLPPEATQEVSCSDELLVEPSQSSDLVVCSLETDAGSVGIVLELPRLWWRVGPPEEEASDDWCDKPLAMTREEFRDRAMRKEELRLRSPVRSVRVGFDDSSERGRKWEAGSRDIAIRLLDFVDCTQITDSLEEEAMLRVRFGDLGGEVAPIRILAEPPPPPPSPPPLPPPPESTLDAPAAYVKSRARGWRPGRGFSYNEIRSAGLVPGEVSVSVDSRRRTTHCANVETLGRTDVAG